jgi:hypothetical protein
VVCLRHDEFSVFNFVVVFVCLMFSFVSRKNWDVFFSVEGRCPLLDRPSCVHHFLSFQSGAPFFPFAGLIIFSASQGIFYLG